MDEPVHEVPSDLVGGVLRLQLTYLLDMFFELTHW